MFNDELLSLYPRQRIRAMDGMAVTAEVWEESHHYHRQLEQFHTLLHHGTGIVAGLDVIASDPPDTSVYIRPGVAVDTLGRTIIMSEPRAFNLGQIEGTLYLIVTYNESRPQPRNGRMDEDAPLYIQSQYSLEAVAELPLTPYVELARVRRRGTDAPIIEANDSARPGINELDLRFRREIGVTDLPQIAVAVFLLPGAEGSRHDEGFANMANELRRTSQVRVWVDRLETLNEDIEQYAMLYLVGEGAFQLDSDALSSLYSYLQKGGTIFYESCRRNVTDVGVAGDQSFQELMESFGMGLHLLENNHDILTALNYFAEPPDGYETRNAEIRVGDGVIFSSYDYGCLWRGERRGRAASRSEIRNAVEWGGNLVVFAADRRAEAEMES